MQSMNQQQSQYQIDKRAHARQEHAHAAPRLEGVVKNVGITKIKKPKSSKMKAGKR